VKGFGVVRKTITGDVVEYISKAEDMVNVAI